MQKISSILPSSGRINKVDFKDSPAVRPGAPSYGQPVGRSTARVSVARDPVEVHKEMVESRSKPSPETAIAEKVAHDFFAINEPVEPSRVGAPMAGEAPLASVEDAVVGMDVSDFREDEVKGNFLDIHA